MLFHSPLYATEPFRFHLSGEPHSLDPQSTASASGNYLAQNLFRGLYRYDRDKGLLPDGAKTCTKSKLRLTCRLEKKFWSNGEPVLASDYVRAFQHLIDPSQKIPQAELLFSVKNAKKIWLGELPTSKLGVSVSAKNELVVDFDNEDPEFQQKLALTFLAPRPSAPIPSLDHAKDLLTNGPYKIKEWIKGQKAILEPVGDDARPFVEVFFIDDDSTALRLYEGGKLSFLRRLVTAQIPAFKNREDFLSVPVGRFDYVGFSESLKNYPLLRKALALSLDYVNFQAVFASVGRPGCPSFPKNFYLPPLCFDFDLQQAKLAFEKEPWPEHVKKKFGFSRLGGDDILRGAEWFQGQWRKNLRLDIELMSQENSVFLQTLKLQPPALFRKGVGLERPSCTAGLEIFTKDSPENLIKFNNPEFDKVVDQIRHASSDTEARRLCTSAIQILMKNYAIIPLGEFNFYMLASPKFKGFKINVLNQLDLSGLRSNPI